MRDSVTRRLAHEPFRCRPTALVITLRRHHCTGCARVWRQDMAEATAPRAKLSRRALDAGHLSISRIAQAMGVSWGTANGAVLEEGRRVLISDPGDFAGVRAIGVDEHVWHHTRRGDKYVTVLVDLTPVRASTGPARLLDMVEDRPKAAFSAWLASAQRCGATR